MIYDIAIVGAGPCGLAVASRLRESTPSALFTDDEHARYWRRFHRPETIEKERKERRCRRPSDAPPSETPRERESEDEAETERSLIVIDAHSTQWMSAWHERFRHLQIDHLRSPLFFHPDPRDRDGLLAFSHFTQRTGHLREIHNVVGREISKHRAKQRRAKKVTRHLRIDDRDRIDYYTPSAEVFTGFCEDIVERYRLQHLIVQAQVQQIDYGDPEDVSSTQLFTLTTDKGTIFSKIVVLAVGPGSKPCIPRDCNLKLEPNLGSVCHCFDNMGEERGRSCLPEHITRRIDQGKETAVVVVGGGLTSAQMADLAIRRGVTKVWLLLRGKYKLKHFDVDLEWVSKVRNQQMAVFWSADSDQERFDLLKEARNGGSITPYYDKILKQHISSNRLEIRTHTRINNGTWNASTHSWTLELTSSPSLPAQIHHIIFATGAPPDIGKLGCMRRIRDKYPVESINGLPRITEDLTWNDHVPLFVTGGLAGLRLGPGAANLAGARQGAERIAWKVDEILGKRSTKASSSSSASSPSSEGSTQGDREGQERQPWETDETRRRSMLERRSEFTGGFANQFEALSMSDG